MDFIIKPDFNVLTSTVSFPTDKLNYFVREEVSSTFGLFQARYNVYGYMRLNKALKFVLHSISGTPLMWQPHRTCGWDPTGSLMIGKKQLEPCKAKINEEFCYDELFDSCYEHFLEWDGSGVLELDENGVEMVNKMVQTLVENAALGSRVALIAGQKYQKIVNSLGAQVFDEKTPANIRQLWNKTIGTCKGVLELLEEMGANPQYAHLNHRNIFVAEDFENGKEYVGDPLQLYDKLFKKARPELKSFINQGGTPGLAGRQGLWPLFMVSDSILASIAMSYIEQTATFPSIGFTPRIGMEEIPNVNGGRSWKIYTIDNVPVIPVSEISHYDKYLTGATHFAAITISRNIQLGTSFASLPITANGDNIGMAIQQESNNLKEYGMYRFLSHALMTATVANTDFISATQVYAKPAPINVGD